MATRTRRSGRPRRVVPCFELLAAESRPRGGGPFGDVLVPDGHVWMRNDGRLPTVGDGLGRVQPSVGCWGRAAGQRAIDSWCSLSTGESNKRGEPFCGHVLSSTTLIGQGIARCGRNTMSIGMGDVWNRTCRARVRRYSVRVWAARPSAAVRSSPERVCPHEYRVGGARKCDPKDGDGFGCVLMWVCERLRCAERRAHEDVPCRVSGMA